MQILKVFWYQKTMENKIQMSLIQTNIKNMMLTIIAINKYVLIISLVSFVSHIWMKMLFTILLIVWLMKVNTTVM